MSEKDTQQDPNENNANEPDLKAELDALRKKAADADKALADIQKFKQLAKEYEAEVARKEQMLKDQEEQKLAEANDWKQLAEKRALELKDMEGKYSSLNSNIVRREKLSVLEKAAMQLGIKNVDDIASFGLDADVVVETTSTGRINVLGADEAVKKLKQDRPYLFKSGSGSINTGEPGVSSMGNAVSFAELEKARVKAETSGDYKEYEKMHQRFMSQGR